MKQRVRDIALSAAEPERYRGFWRKLALAMSRPGSARLLAFVGALANIISGVVFLGMFAVACGVIGDLPEQDRIPVAAIFHAVVGWWSK